MNEEMFNDLLRINIPTVLRDVDFIDFTGSFSQKINNNNYLLTPVNNYIRLYSEVNYSIEYYTLSLDSLCKVTSFRSNRYSIPLKEFLDTPDQTLLKSLNFECYRNIIKSAENSKHFIEHAAKSKSVTFKTKTLKNRTVSTQQKMLRTNNFIYDYEMPWNN